MGVLDRFEKGIERAVSSAFAKAFRSEVQPVEIASALRRESDDRAKVVGRNRTLAPNVFVVELGPADHDRLGEWEDALGEELRQVVTDHARQQRYAFVGAVSVRFEMAEDLDTGVFRVRSSTARPGDGHDDGAPGAPAHAVPPAAPAARRAQAEHAPLLSGAPPPAPPLVATVPTLEVDGHLHRLTSPVTVLGRAADADVVLDDPGVSRRHAEVHLVGGSARVVDLGSTNGTFVDGERVRSAALDEGSTIAVGRSRLVYSSRQR